MTLRAVAPRQVVVLGGGVAAIEASLALVDLTDGAARVALVAPNRDVALDALAPARGFDVASIASLSLRDLAAAHRFRYVADAAEAIDVEAHMVRCRSGDAISYESLLVAIGARPMPALSHGMTYRGSESHEELRRLREDIAGGTVASVAVVVPPGVTWALPGYELAFLLAREGRLTARDLAVVLVTAEPDPLGVFGPAGSAATTELLDAAGIELRVSTAAEAVPEGIRLRPGEQPLHVDRVVSLPRAGSIPLPGLPVDRDGFIVVDGHGRVPGCRDVYAAGDCRAFPIKQGGLAALQAHVAAAHIAAEMGVEVATPTFRPVMRGKLITGDAEWFLRNPIAGGGGRGDVDDQPLWMPATKVWGQYLPRELEEVTEATS